MSKKAIFFDRDGVINKVVLKNSKPYPPHTLKELKLTKGIRELLNFSNKLDFLNIIVTNQPDPNRGRANKDSIKEINDYISDELAIDKIYVCWDEKDGLSNYRKPKPGMILRAIKDFNIDVKKSYLVGDRWKDINAGHAAGCKTIFIDYKYNESLDVKPNFTINSLEEIKSIIVN